MNWEARNLFYQEHLNRVSRSFAFCIEQLKGEFRGHIALSYILFRLLDTIEDAQWANSQDQSKSFEKFFGFLESLPSRETIEQWHAEFPPIPEGERLLLQDSAQFFSDFHSLTLQNRHIICTGLKSMGRGMQYYLNQSQTSPLVLRNLVEVNRYCFFVAGVVGELLESLFASICEPRSRDHSRLIDAFHFGLFLQKVNILKDQASDEIEGRHLVPSRGAVVESLRQNAAHAMKYLESIPVQQKAYRIFCAWSLFLGLASLPYIQKSHELRMKHKISRLKTWHVLNKVKSIISDNTKLARYFDKLLSDFFGAYLNAEIAYEGGEKLPFVEFERLYEGDLSHSDLPSLGMV